MTKESQGMIHPQTGSNENASQRGMSVGSLRHGSDLPVEKMSQKSQGILHLQTGKQTLHEALRC